MSVRVESNRHVFTVVLSRPERRNAVDATSAAALADAFRRFEADDDARVAVLWGEGGDFCAGADLQEVAAGRPNRLERVGDAPMGPSRMKLSKPLIAAIEGFAVAGGLELALLADLRVAARDATLGVFCRRFGVPLIDGGTVRLPSVVGLGRALDLILSGRAVDATEAHAMGLVNRVVEPGEARAQAEAWAADLAALPQACLLSDRESVYASMALSPDEALKREFDLGLATLEREGFDGAVRFTGGAGRHGKREG